MPTITPSAHGSLHRLISAYEERFAALDAELPAAAGSPSPRALMRRARDVVDSGRTQRGLARRFMTAHARASVDELERILHRRVALEPAPVAEAMLADLSHFRASLRPPLPALARTLIVVGIVLIAQLLGRIPSIPIVTGADRTPATGSLSEAVDVDPGHVAKAVSDLLGSPLSTICGALATLAAAGVIVMGPTVPAYRRCRRSIRARGADGEPAVAELERELFDALRGGAPPRRRRVDLMVCWAAVALAVTMGGAWYLAYLRGLFRDTPSLVYALAGEGSPRAVYRTVHPTFLGYGGFVAIAAGAVAGVLLWRRAPNQRLRRLVRPPARGRAGQSTFAAVAILPVLTIGGLAALRFPAVHSYHDPYLVAQAVRSRPTVLALQPVIPFALSCRPAPCTVVKAGITVTDAHAAGGLGAAPVHAEAHVGPSVPMLTTLDTAGADQDAVKARFGLADAAAGGTKRSYDRVVAKSTQLVTLVPESPGIALGAARPLPQPAGVIRDVLDRYPGFLLPEGPYPQRRTAARMMYNVLVLAIVVSDDDLSHLLEGLQSPRQMAAAIDIEVHGRDRRLRTIHVPFAVLGAASRIAPRS